MFIVIDGIDGSGKSTVVKAMKSLLESEGKKSFDLVAWCKEKGTIPTLSDIADADILFTAEPTYAWTGAAMRQEMFLTNEPYSALAFAHAFSLDRLVLMKRLILPALAAGKTIIQDRSVSTSIIYQPAMDDGPSLEEILELPGNVLALQNAPDHLILLDIEPEVAIKRVGGRSDEKPEDVFETIEQLKTFDERFRSDWFAKLYTDRGSQIHWMKTSDGLKTSQENAKKLITKLLS